MKKGTKRLVGLALACGTLGATLLLRRRRKMTHEDFTDGQRRHGAGGDRWARPGMSVTFRAELMPSRDRDERTFRVAEFMPSGRVTLVGVAGEHTESEFEPLRR